jgi:hypothetical protein
MCNTMKLGIARMENAWAKWVFLCCWSRTETHLTNEVALGSALVVSVDRSLRSANLNFWHVNV